MVENNIKNTKKPLPRYNKRPEDVFSSSSNSQKKPTPRFGGQTKTDSPEPQKKMMGIGFYMVVGMALLGDLIDVPANATLVLSLFSSALGILTSFIVWLYLLYNNVTWGTRRLATYVISLIIGVTPIINILPTFSFSLFIIRALENNALLKKAAEISHGKVVNISVKKGKVTNLGFKKAA